MVNSVIQDFTKLHKINLYQEHSSEKVVGKIFSLHTAIQR